jgi:hypothetical protein
MKKQRRSLTDYNPIPDDMRAYLRNYDYSFSRKACEFAVSLMRKDNPVTKKPEPIEPWSREQVDDLLKRNNITLENNIGYNYVYVANMLRADKFKSSIPDEAHLALGIKDVIDDVDCSPYCVFLEWMAKMDGNGEPIEWSELI